MTRSGLLTSAVQSNPARKRRFLCFFLLLLTLHTFATLGSEARAAIITKPPDLGPTWQPLDPVFGSYVYANTFVSPASGLVTNLGMWLSDEINGAPGNGGTDIRFEVYGSVGGDPVNGPDSTNVLATTGTLSGLGIGPLALYNAAPQGGGTPLVAGQTYWFGASVVGESGVGGFQTGGHTQNSVVVDNGTFWFTNDPAGLQFIGSSGGQNITPEIAFTVTVVPEPSTLWLALPGAAMLLSRRRRRSA